MLSCMCFLFYICKLETWEEPVAQQGFLYYCLLIISFYVAAPIGRITFIIPLTYKIMGESMALKSKTKNPLLNKINCKQTQGNPLKGPAKRFTLPCGK